jgi:hypothetical protein
MSSVRSRSPPPLTIERAVQTCQPERFALVGFSISNTRKIMKFVSMLFVLPALFFACRDQTLEKGPDFCEGRVDSGVDTAADTAVDTGIDTGDTSIDTGADTADTSADTGTDTAVDSGDTGPVDTGADTGTDTGATDTASTDTGAADTAMSAP